MPRRLSWQHLVSANRRIAVKVVTACEDVAELRDLDTLKHFSARFIEDNGATYAIVEGMRYLVEPGDSQDTATGRGPRGRPRR